jgi:AP2 domain/HNH endonuclease
MPRQIPLTQHRFATVDDDDYPRLSQERWCFAANKSGGYAVRMVNADGRRRSLYLHRTLVPTPPPGHEVIFRNHDTLDCRKENLAVVTAAEARRHHRRRRDSGSRYKGVCRQESGRFLATIRLNGKPVNLGQFTTEEEAARAYDRMAAQHFGPFAELNFPATSPERSAGPSAVPHSPAVEDDRGNPAAPEALPAVMTNPLGRAEP